ncbi:hypothetical protein AAFF_G00150780 [Aldrovandia affinis]|uniref:Uncharacterized protein n=1 Tax=Aldrovandia affinis TaxID=143900 RepID=A0AAD7W8G7_9TELE|nr:hypothetical protein AAFF_G00150780 [Aldrovandia affinis]
MDARTLLREHGAEDDVLKRVCARAQAVCPCRGLTHTCDWAPPPLNGPEPLIHPAAVLEPRSRRVTARAGPSRFYWFYRSAITPTAVSTRMASQLFCRAIVSAPLAQRQEAVGRQLFAGSSTAHSVFSPGRGVRLRARQRARLAAVARPAVPCCWRGLSRR